MELAQTVAQIAKRITKHSKGGGIGEQNTKATLIEPMLRALGWDPEDLDEVCREFKAQKQERPVDYALLLRGQPVFFVEAKALGTNLDDPACAHQIMGYAAVAGVDWIVLTDGNHYRLYNAHASVRVEEKLFFSVAVSDASQEVVQRLGLLAKDCVTSGGLTAAWEAHFVDRQLIAGLQALVGPEPDDSLVRLLSKRLTGLTGRQIRRGLRRVRLTVAQAEVELPPPELGQTRTADEYRRVIMAYLARQPGRAASLDCIRDAVLSELAPAGPDLELRPTGVLRWKYRVAGALRHLIRQGRMRKREDGLWQLVE